MADQLRRSLTIHARTQKRVAGELVTYVDGETEIEVVAVRAQANEAGQTGDGDFYISTIDMDWLIITDELKTEDGETITPRAGATITPIENPDGTYEVTKGPNGKTHRPGDTRQVRLRIHTDKVDG